MERRAYWCSRCEPPIRHFLLKGRAIPECKHGRLQRQANGRYFGRATLTTKPTGRGKA